MTDLHRALLGAVFNYHRLSDPTPQQVPDASALVAAIEAVIADHGSGTGNGAVLWEGEKAPIGPSDNPVPDRSVCVTGRGTFAVDVPPGTKVRVVHAEGGTR